MAERLCFLTGKIVKDKKKNKSPEAAVGRAVDAYLKAIGAYIRTIKSDGTKTATGWRKSAQGSGISDRIGILSGGRFIAVELKATGKKKTTTDVQAYFLLKIIDNGGVACVADSIDDVKLALTQSKEELRSTLLSLTTKKESPRSLEPLFP